MEGEDGRCTHRYEEEQDLERDEEEREVYPPKRDDTREEDDLDGQAHNDERRRNQARARVVLVLARTQHKGVCCLRGCSDLARRRVQGGREPGDKDRAHSAG